MIAVIDYGVGNLGSIGNMLKRIGVSALITKDLDIINEADKLILPGVGNFDAGINGLKDKGLIPLLREKVMDKGIPLLGICLGMQLLLDRSEEGNEPGLGFISGEVRKFPSVKMLKIPHMGWNAVKSEKENELVKSVPEPMRFYFAHSYYAVTQNDRDSFLWTEYGIKFASGICSDNVYGVQFHPEKSHKYGMKLLYNFAVL